MNKGSLSLQNCRQFNNKLLLQNGFCFFSQSLLAFAFPEKSASQTLLLVVGELSVHDYINYI